MSKLLRVKYQCQHPSCQVFCKRGELMLEEEELAELSEVLEGKDIFRSPRHICRMGFSQPFKALSVTELVEGSVAEEGAALSPEDANDVVSILKREHQEVLNNLEIIEGAVRKRDINLLWKATCDVQNEIMLHSLKKEEEVLFPYVAKKVPAGPAYIQIVLEDHKEFVTLLQAFRNSLHLGEILDGIISSIIVNLRNHIAKEDKELFTMVDEHLSDGDKKAVLKGFAKIDAEFVPIEAGDIKAELSDELKATRRMMDFEIQSVKSMGTTDDWSCH